MHRVMSTKKLQKQLDAKERKMREQKHEQGERGREGEREGWREARRGRSLKYCLDY